MQLAAVNAMYDDLHADRPFHDGTFTFWGEKRTGMTPFHYREGVAIWLSKADLTPDDDFLGQGSTPPPIEGHGDDHADAPDDGHRSEHL